MVVKIIGMAIVFAALSLTGVYYGNIDGYRVADLLEMKKALSILKSEIEYAMTPLPEALLNAALRTKKPVSGMLIKLEELMRVRRSESVGVLWEQAVESCAKQSYFTAEDKEQFISFGKTLGYLDKSMQLHNINAAMDYINEKTACLNATRHKNKKLYQSLGVLSGLLFVVIFI